MQFHLTTQFTILARQNKNKKRKLSNLRHSKKFREPKRRFILLCEGKNTEPEYFKALKRIRASTLIRIEIVPGVGVPMTIAEMAVERAKLEGIGKKVGRKKNSFEKKDEIWAIFDRDEHPQFEDAVNKCEKNGIEVGRSNPCFELWLILHEQDYDQYLDRHQIQKKLSELVPEYDRRGTKTPNCDEIVTRVEIAEQRSEKQLKRREEEKAPYGNPSTTVGLLTQAIREANRSSSRP